MKKILVLIAGLMLVVSTSFAASVASTASSSSTGYWVIQAQGGIGLPISSAAATQLSLGFNGEAQVGYAFSKDFSLSLEGGVDTLQLNTDTVQKENGATGATFTSVPSLTHIPLELVAQYNMTGGSVTPYVLLGVGVAFDSFGGTLAGSVSGSSFSDDYTSQSWTNLEVDPGFGVAFSLSDKVNLFVQGKLDMDFGSNAVGPTQESTDSPIMIIPIQVGVNFGL